MFLLIIPVGSIRDKYCNARDPPDAEVLLCHSLAVITFLVVFGARSR